MYEVMCCDFRFAIAKVLILPKAKKLLCLNFTNAAKVFFNRKFTLFTLLPLKALFYSFTFLLFYFFTLLLLNVFLLFYFFTFICTFA